MLVSGISVRTDGGRHVGLGSREDAVVSRLSVVMGGEDDREDDGVRKRLKGLAERDMVSWW
jgi:hypothetical protein